MHQHTRHAVIQYLSQFSAVQQTIQRRNFHHLHIEVKKIGLQYLARKRADAAIQHNLVAAGHAQRHHGRFGAGSGPIVKRSIADIQTGQAADGGLIFKKGLQSSLGTFRLIRCISGVEFSPTREVINHGRNYVIVKTAPDKVEQLAVSCNDSLHSGKGFKLGHAGGKIKRLGPQIGRNRGKKFLDAGNADGGQHFLFLFRRMRAVVTIIHKYISSRYLP